MYKKRNLPIGYKQTKIGIIPTHWDVKSLAECFSISAGRDLIKETFSATKTIEHCFPIFSNSMENRGLYGYTSNPRYTAGSLTVTGRGTLGVAEFRTESFDAIIRLLVLTPKMELCGKIIAEYINYKKPFFFECTGIPQLTAPQISKILIPIPPIEEQKKIAEVLSEWDRAIELQTKLIEKLELRKRALMQRLLTGRVRLNGFSEKWETKYLRDLFVERNEIRNGHLPLLSITADKGIILQSESDKRDNSNEDKSKYKRICPNDIGYNTMRMWQGRSALSNMEGLVSPAYTVVTPNSDVNPIFIISIIQQPRTVYDFWSHSQGLVDDTLNCKFPNFSQVRVFVPTLKEQTAIAKVLIAADKEIEIERQRLSMLQTQKRGLMQQLLTGKKRMNIKNMFNKE